MQSRESRDTRTDDIAAYVMSHMPGATGAAKIGE